MLLIEITKFRINLYLHNVSTKQKSEHDIRDEIKLFIRAILNGDMRR